MAVEFKRNWTESDVNALIGQSESIRREFKAGMMFDREPQPSKWAENLSREVSALANTEGGELILGVEEDKKTKPRVAIGIDGVPDTIGPERLQQLIEGNISPYLPGIRFHRVRLSARPGRVVVVIQIPQGTTAYQANDGRYYGRSEFEAKHLQHHEIHLRMMRGQLARATLSIFRAHFITAAEEYQARVKRVANIQKAIEETEKELKIDFDDPSFVIRRNRGSLPHELEKANEALAAPRFEFNEYSFDLLLTNAGGTTIRDFYCTVQNASCNSLFASDAPFNRQAAACPIGSSIDLKCAPKAGPAKAVA